MAGLNFGETLKYGRVKTLNGNPLHDYMIHMWLSNKVYVGMR